MKKEVEQTPLSSFFNMNSGLHVNNSNSKQQTISPQPIKLESASSGQTLLNMFEKKGQKTPVELIESSFQSLCKQSSLTKPKLMPPTMFLAKNIIGEQSSNGHPAAIHKPDPLTQSQLLQAMTYLMETDPDFTKKLHEAYLKSYKSVSL